MRIINFLFFFLFVLLVVSLLFGGMYFLLSKVFTTIQESLTFSPFEDNMIIENNNWCMDSDNGIFSTVKGVVNVKQGFLFIKWNTNLDDECDGNQLNEYYCTSEKNVYGRGIIECSYGCLDGACKISY